MFLLGTIVNAFAVLCGAGIGIVLPRISDRVQSTVMQGLALAVILIGLGMALSDKNDILVIIISLVAGGLIGEWINIEGWLKRFGEAAERRASKFNTGKFAEAFIATSLIYCVGSMAIVGAIQSGVHNDHRILYAKSMIDGFSAIVFASALGPGVALSALPVFVYEGAIATLAYLLGGAVNSPAVIAASTATGGLLIVGIGIGMLGLKKIHVGNLLPSIFVAAFLKLSWPYLHLWLQGKAM